eukprot:371503-Prymnesium_polylepis.1
MVAPDRPEGSFTAPDHSAFVTWTGRFSIGKKMRCGSACARSAPRVTGLRTRELGDSHSLLTSDSQS